MYSKLMQKYGGTQLFPLPFLFYQSWEFISAAEILSFKTQIDYIPSQGLHSSIWESDSRFDQSD